MCRLLKYTSVVVTIVYRKVWIMKHEILSQNVKTVYMLMLHLSAEPNGKVVSEVLYMPEDWLIYYIVINLGIANTHIQQPTFSQLLT